MKLERFRKFNTRDVYSAQTISNDMCWAVKAGNRIFLRGQTGFDLEQELVGANDVAAQTEQAMLNAKQVLEEVGSSLEHVCKVITYITDRAYREPVYEVVGRHLKGIPTVATGLIVKGLAVPDMKVELDIEAEIPADASGHAKFRPFNTGNWFGQNIDRDSCMVVRTGNDIYLRGQTGARLDGSEMIGTGYSVEDAGLQADQAMKNAKMLLEEAGSSLSDICKLRVYIADRAYREAVYQAIGSHFGDVHPCSTGLIMRGFARAGILCEIDMAGTLSQGVPHERFRRFVTEQQYKDGQDLRCKFAMAVRAGNRVYLRGQTGATLEGDLQGDGDPGAQTEQAMRNIKQLLSEAGATLNDICKVTTYIGDRAYRNDVYNVIGKWLKGVHPVGTGLIVDGFATPRTLVEVDVEAVIQHD